MRVASLSTRLLSSVTLLLILFFGLTILALDFVFRDLSERAIRDRLEVQVLAMISASEETAAHDLLPAQQLAESSRFANPGSGLYGEVRRRNGAPAWRSASLAGTELWFPDDISPGKRRFGQLKLANGSPVLALSIGVRWEFDDRRVGDFVFSAAENLEPYYAQLNQLRVQMFGWFAVLLILLLGALAFLFRSLLSPLRRIESEIGAIEVGELAELGDGYPRELRGVTSNMNALLRSERERMARYRNTLGNLAHSLKTPLAVMRNLLQGPELKGHTVSEQLDEQVERMDGIVRYQLKRAAASGATGLGSAPIAVSELLTPLRAALLKVYADRDISCELDIVADAQFVGDREDFTELAGNLLDNAFKWCRHRIRITATHVELSDTRRRGLNLIVEDDGPGIPLQERAHVLERGARLDERVSGQGIGLSIVRDLVEVTGGKIEIGESELGGARICVRLLG
ncbi:MAG: ATP-binding protein [Steroidobacteraceae bacterium]